LHRYSIFPYVQRYARFGGFLLGVAYARSTGATIASPDVEIWLVSIRYRNDVAAAAAAVRLKEHPPRADQVQGWAVVLLPDRLGWTAVSFERAIAAAD
jgi:hypothetical protein